MKKEIVNPILHKIEQMPDSKIYLFVLILLEVLGQMSRNFYLKMLKPLPIILLLIFFSNTKTKEGKLVFYGLIFSLFGDISLMFKDPLIFQFGTFMFLLAHLFYIWSFSLSVNILSLKMLTKHEKISTLSACVGVIIILIINTSALWEKITNLPLFVSYGIVLSLMAIFALLRIGKVRGKAFWYVTLGALIFGVSDNLLATLKFNHIHTDIGRGIIMITYYGAQYLIVEGSVENQKNSK